MLYSQDLSLSFGSPSTPCSKVSVLLVPLARMLFVRTMFYPSNISERLEDGLEKYNQTTVKSNNFFISLLLFLKAVGLIITLRFYFLIL
jgi:hypothetical protein